MQSITKQCQIAHQASKEIGIISTETKNQVLRHMAKAIETASSTIIKANKLDIDNGKANNLSDTLLDRLTLNETSLKAIAKSLLLIESLPDPVGETLDSWVRPNGLKITKTRVPLGVVGIIYEARPNVTADAIGLCIKTGNAVVLRGSSSAYNSNLAITNILKQAAKEANINPECIQLLENSSREGVQEFVQMDQFLSVIIPRGGADLIKSVVKNSTVPTIETGVGNCHTYVDKSANFKKAVEIIINAKTQRPSVCNACETLLIHQGIVEEFAPIIIPKLEKLGVEIRACEKLKIIQPNLGSANNEDWATEYLDLILSVKVVQNLEEAIEHITKYGTTHSECIISEKHSG